MDTETISIAEAVKRTGIGRYTIDKWVHEDPTFPCIKVGEGRGRTRIPVQALMDWLNEKATSGRPVSQPRVRTKAPRVVNVNLDSPTLRRIREMRAARHEA